MRSTQRFLITAACALLAGTGPALGSGTITVQFGGGGSPQFVVSGYPDDQIPANACGFRLEQPGGWDGGWHFAVSSPGDIYVDQIFGEISNDTFGTVPDGPDPGNAPDLPEFIQMTGPIHPGCDDNLYLFSTPAVASLGTQEAPGNSNYFVAGFWDDGDIVWLGGAGEVIPFPEPPGEAPPETPDFCETWPDLCKPGTPGVDQQFGDELMNPFSCSLNPFGPGCPPPLDQVGRATGMLMVLGDGGEVAVFFLSKAALAKPDEARRMMRVPLAMLAVLEKDVALLGKVMRRIERDTRLVADGAPVRAAMLSASAASGRAEIETRACRRALRGATAALGKGKEEAREALNRATARCVALAGAAERARNALMRLYGAALPAELLRGQR